MSYDFDLFDETIAKEFKLKEIETKFVMSEERMQTVVRELNDLVRSEEEHRTANESTFTRVTRLGGFSVLFLVGLSLGQIVYMRNFFKQKKLI